MAVDMFMAIDDLKGESVDKAKAGQIDVLAWSWGVSNSGSAHVGGGAGAGKATLIVRKAGEKPLEYLTVTMTEVMITSVSTGGSGGEDRLTENVTLNFAAVKVDYVEQAKGGTKGATPSMLWNIAENANE